jgi:hypothetical protein
VGGWVSAPNSDLSRGGDGRTGANRTEAKCVCVW